MRVGKGITIFLLLFMLPQCALAAEDNPLAYRATHVNEYAVGEGMFEVYTGDEMHTQFARDAVVPDVSLPFLTKLSGVICQNDSAQEVAEVVAEYNRTYFSSLFSGIYQLHPRAAFVSEGIYQEANARTFYDMFAHPNAGLGADDVDFALEIEQLWVRDDVAKVLVRRHAGDFYDEDIKSNGSREGYVLTKEKGTWRIENIIFESTGFTNDTFGAFRRSLDAEDWTTTYGFSSCQRKDYEAGENFSDYLTGSVDEPALDLETAKFADLQ